MATPTVFAQVIALGHREAFHRCVRRYHGDGSVRDFSCHGQWLAIAFVQLTCRDNLRDLESSRSAHAELIYQMGFRSRMP